jgi:hypothetical protein
MGTSLAAEVLDGFPVSEGHSLVIPTRHVELLFELPEAELLRVWSLVAEVHPGRLQRGPSGRERRTGPGGAVPGTTADGGRAEHVER